MNLLKELKNNTYLKNFLIIVCTCFIIPILISNNVLNNLLNDAYYTQINKFLSFFIFFFINIAFLPALILIYIILKKNKNKFVRTFFIAFIIPFNNLFYCFIASILTGNIAIHIENIAVALGLLWLFAILPFGFIFNLFIPKKMLVEKYYILLTMILMEIFGFIMLNIAIDLLIP